MEQPILTFDAAQLFGNEGGAPAALLGRCLALRYRGFLSAPACARHAAGVYEGRAFWIGSFEDSQFSLGRAWYTDLELGRAEAYFATAAASDRQVERFLPGLQDLLLDAISRVLSPCGASVPVPVRRRRGWCGPGVHIFPAGAWVSRHGGEVHFDVEGIADEDLLRRAPALTLILVLQPPRRGGGLRVWALRYEGEDFPSDPPGPDHIPSAIVPYETGDLVVLDSYRLHKIEPFAGPEDRITATVHAVYTSEGWEAWF
jgi:hypothetical protein